MPATGRHVLARCRRATNNSVGPFGIFDKATLLALLARDLSEMVLHFAAPDREKLPRHTGGQPAVPLDEILLNLCRCSERGIGK